jgi:hypothetical protein
VSDGNITNEAISYEQNTIKYTNMY